MAGPERRTEQSTISERQLFEDLLTEFNQAKIDLPVRDALLESMERLSLNPDRLFSIVTRSTMVRPSRVRAIVGGASSWERWIDFKIGVVIEIIRHELNDRDRSKLPTPPQSSSIS